jgi:hypothetical protein
VCGADLTANDFDDPAAVAASKCLSADFEKLTGLVKPSGALADPRLYSMLNATRQRALLSARAAVLTAKRETGLARRRVAQEHIEHRADTTNSGDSGTRCTAREEQAAQGTGMSCAQFMKAVRCMQSLGFFRGCTDYIDDNSKFDACNRAARRCGATN